MKNQSQLFEPPKPRPVWSDSLEAAANGTVGLAWSRREQEDILDSDWHNETLEIAQELGLTVVTRPVPPGENSGVDFPLTDVFALRFEESWRIEPLVAVMRRQTSDCLWSDNMEFLTRAYIGHSPDKILALQAQDRHNRLGWIGQTAYLLLCAEQFAQLKQCALRCFPSDFDLDSTVPFQAKCNGRLRTNISELIPADMTLCRFTLANIFSIRLFEGPGATSTELVRQSKFNCLPFDLNTALRSPIEFWDDEWRSPQTQPYPGPAIRVP